MVATNTSKADVLRGSTASLNPALKKLMDEETKTVKGRFKNYETPGGNLPFCAGKYPGQPIFKQVFQDGGTYDVPLWVARHLNGFDKVAKERNGKIGSCSYAVHGFKWDPSKPAPENQLDGQGAPVPIVGESKRIQRYGFESMDFDPTS